jgi:hypothetical protein
MHLREYGPDCLALVDDGALGSNARDPAVCDCVLVATAIVLVLTSDSVDLPPRQDASHIPIERLSGADGMGSAIIVRSPRGTLHEPISSHGRLLWVEA